jgi:hypothetical protein
MSEHSLGVKWKQPSCSPPGLYVPLSKRPVPCRLIKRSEMLLANCIDTSSVQSFYLVTIGCLKRGKGSDVTGLELVGGVRGKTTKNNVVLKAKLQDLQCLVCPEAITDQHPWFSISQSFGLRIKNTL